MAPRRTGKVRVEELQVNDDPAGARADGDHHHHKNKTQSKAKRAHEDYSRMGWDGKLLQSTLIAVSQVKATKKK